MRRATRRKFLATGFLLGSVALAGCTDASDDAETVREENETDTTDSTGNGEENESDAEPSASDDHTEEQEQHPFPEYETTAVEIVTPEGEQLGSVTAAIAETSEEWTVGLSDTESLPEDWGMLFVTGSVADREFWMRDMDFSIDIIFVDDERRITGIHHAPEPGPDEDGRDQRYSGRGQYVLEVNYRWTERHGVTEGDILRFDR